MNKSNPIRSGISASVGLVFVAIVMGLSSQASAYSNEDSLAISDQILTTCMKENDRTKAASFYSITARPDGCTVEQVMREDGQYKNLMVAERERTTQFFGDITQNRLREALATYFVAELRFGDVSVKPDVVSRFCTGSDTVSMTSYSVCGDTDRAQLLTMSQETLSEVRKQSTLVSREKPAGAVAAINAQLTLLNLQIDQVNASGIDEKGIAFITREPVLNEATQKLYEEYYTSCLDSQNTKAGVLLQSEYLMGKSGRCRLPISKGNLGFERQDGRYVIPHHKMIEASDVEKSLRSLRDLLGVHITDAITQDSWVREQGSDLKEAAGSQIVATQLRVGSASLGLALLEDPYMAGWVCKGVQRNEDDAKDLKTIEKWSDGITLLAAVTGIGSLAELGSGLILRGMVRGAIREAGIKGLSSEALAGMTSSLSRGRMATWLLGNAQSMAAVASALSLVDMPILYSLYARELESLRALQEQAVRISLSGAYDIELAQTNAKEQKEVLLQKHKHQMQLVLSGLLLPLDAAVVGTSAVALLKYTKMSESSLSLATQAVLDGLSAHEKIRFFDYLKTLSPQQMQTLATNLDALEAGQRLAQVRQLTKVQGEPATNIVTAKNTSAGQLSKRLTTAKQAESSTTALNRVLKQVGDVLKSFRLTQEQTLTFLKFLDLRGVKDTGFALQLVQSLSPERFRATVNSPMVLGFAVKHLTNFSSRTAVALQKSRSILAEWSDTMVSGLTVAYHRAHELTLRMRGLKQEEALEQVLKNDGLNEAQIKNLNPCMKF